MIRTRKGLFIAVLAAVLLVAGSAFLWRPSLFFDLPSREGILAQTLAPSSQILDRNGLLLYEIIDPQSGVHRPRRLDQIPLHLRQAVIATEDASFYRNPGIDLRAIARAAWMNLQSGGIVSGGSTITQQLARNLLMAPEAATERTWRRKLHEALLAYHLTRTLSKDEILALYLNETYFGGLAYGIEGAARSYLNKSAIQLDLAESALLVGLPQAPSAYDPRRHPEAAKARQRVVLNLMVSSGYLSGEEADVAFAEPVKLASGTFPIEAPHACMEVWAQVRDLLGVDRLRQGGLRIHTTVDLHLQAEAEMQVRRHLERLNQSDRGSPGHNVGNAAVIALDPESGALLAMLGSPDFFDAGIDGALNATMAMRQPGSALKPLTYAAAFEAGLAPATVFLDVPRVYETKEGSPYVPINYDRRWHGPVSLRQSLACSYNVVAVELLDRIGVTALPKMAQRLGIRSLNDAERFGLALTLGSGEVRLVDLVTAYGVFARGGLAVEPYLVERIEDEAGQDLFQHAPFASNRLLDERIAFLVSDILADDDARAPAFGANGVLALPYPAAVKTGTTTDWRDNWTIGYTPDLVVGVWVGNANNEPMMHVSGVDGAAPIWREVMLAGHSDPDIGPPSPFVRPPGLTERQVCAESGLLPAAACYHRVQALYLPQDAPKQSCTLHRLVTIDLLTGLPAGLDCPPVRQATRRATLWPAEALAWAEEEGLVTPLDRWAMGSSPQGREALWSVAGGGDLLSALPAHEGVGLRIARPGPGSVYQMSAALPDSAQRIEVSVIAPQGARPDGVRLLVDGALWMHWGEGPYSALLPLRPGAHELVAECGERRSEPVHILVQPAPDARIEPVNSQRS